MDETDDELFTAFEIRDAIGLLADGRMIDTRLIPLVRAAVSGLFPTSDRGEQQFIVGISKCGQFNVDTEELIWPRSPGDDIFDDLPLRVLTDRDLLKAVCQRWENEDPGSRISEHLLKQVYEQIREEGKPDGG